MTQNTDLFDVRIDHHVSDKTRSTAATRSTREYVLPGTFRW